VHAGRGGTRLYSQYLGGRGRGKGKWISEFEASLVYRVSSRTARATQRNPVSKKERKKKKDVCKGLRDDSKVKRMAVLSEDHSPEPIRWPPTIRNSSSAKSEPSSGLYGYCMHTVHMYTYRQTILTSLCGSSV
jgi:hypothetical protein